MLAARLFVVKGRVQGVWFRESTRRYAEPLGIRGHALNLPNGDVEVLAVGEQAAIQALQAWLQDGPPLARVTEVIASEVVDGSDPVGFTTGQAQA